MKIYAFAAALAVGSTISAAAVTPPAGPVHIRGTIQTVAPGQITVTTATGPVMIDLDKPLKVIAVIPSDSSKIQNNAYVGITSVPTPDGGQRALEVHVFPESMRGAGEGSRDWDLAAPGSNGAHSRMTNGSVTLRPVTTSHSRMTNGTITHAGSTLVVTYNGNGSSGSQTIVIPAGIPIVTFKPGTPALLKKGAHVIVFTTRDMKNALHADRVTVGVGVVPPM